MISRRTTLLGLGAGALATTPAAALVPTPRQTPGPFYPDVLPRESDADLTRVGTGPQATGEVIEVAGRVLDPQGRPVPGGVVELWQANAWGRYAHSLDRRDAPLDPAFQGFGVVRADAEGRYRFRTILPGLYPGRTRHLHFRFKAPGSEWVPTQMYFEGEPGNARDFLLQSVRDPRARDGLTVAFAPKGDEPSVAAGIFDIVIG